MRGRKPKPRHLRIIGGNAGHRPLPVEVVVDIAFDSELQPPRRLRKRPQELWDEYIRRCAWLTHLDRPLAAAWCDLMAQFERAPSKMVAGMVSQLRGMTSELGLNPSSRARLGELPQRLGEDRAAKYLGGPK